MTAHDHKFMIIWQYIIIRIWSYDISIKWYDNPLSDGYDDITIFHHKDTMTKQSIVRKIWWYEVPSSWVYHDMAIYEMKRTMIWSLVGYAHFAMIYFRSLTIKGYLVWFEHISKQYNMTMKLRWCDNGVKFAGDAVAWSSTTLQAGWEMWPLKMCASKNRHQLNTSNSPPW